MRSLVVDASAVVDLLLRNRLGVEVRTHLTGASLHTVAHLDAEVFSALARIHRGGALGADSVTARLDLLGSLDMHRVPISTGLMHAGWALRDNITARDALYVALAMTIECPLLTTDRTLARAVPDLAVGIG